MVKAVVENTESGKEVMGLFLKQWGDKVKIIERVVKAVVENIESGKEIIGLFFK